MRQVFNSLSESSFEKTQLLKVSLCCPLNSDLGSTCPLTFEENSSTHTQRGFWPQLTEDFLFSHRPLYQIHWNFIFDAFIFSNQTKKRSLTCFDMVVRIDLHQRAPYLCPTLHTRTFMAQEIMFLWFFDALPQVSHLLSELSLPRTPQAVMKGTWWHTVSMIHLCMYYYIIMHILCVCWNGFKIYINVYVYVCVRTHITYTYIYIHIHTYTYIYIYIHIYTYIYI